MKKRQGPRNGVLGVPRGIPIEPSTLELVIGFSEQNKGSITAKVEFSREGYKISFLAKNQR